jgi:hypothetical protein
MLIDKLKDNIMKDKNGNEIDWGWLAMEDVFDVEEAERGSDFIIKNNITPNLD